MASALSKYLSDLLLVIIFSVMVISGARSEVTNEYEREEEEVSISLQKMIQTAIEERNEAILSLRNEESEDGMMIKSLLLSWRDDEGNTILHLAAKKAPPHILGSTPGGALSRLPQYLKWFKKVESIKPGELALIQNKNQETARDIFSKEHKVLVKEAEECMRSSAKWLMLAALLIAFTVVHYISIIGRIYNSSTDMEIIGFPFMDLALYLAFASSLLSAVTFYSICTSSFPGADFLTSLPLLVKGLVSLIFSIAITMVVASTAKVYSWKYRTGLVFVVIPGTVLAFSEVKLLRQMFRSTNGRIAGVNTSHDQDKLLRVFRRNYYKP